MITRFNAEKYENIQKKIAFAITDLDTSIKAKGFGIHKTIAITDLDTSMKAKGFGIH